MSTATMPSLAGANAARSAAQRQRAEALTRVTMGMSSVTAILQEACLPDGKALLRLPLIRLLSAPAGTSKNRAKQIIFKVHELLGLPCDDATANRVTVMWLLDARAGGKRMLAFADATSQKHDAPWYGFPYSPQVAPVVQAKQGVQ